MLRNSRLPRQGAQAASDTFRFVLNRDGNYEGGEMHSHPNNGCNGRSVTNSSCREAGWVFQLRPGARYTGIGFTRITGYCQSASGWLISAASSLQNAFRLP